MAHVSSLRPHASYTKSWYQVATALTWCIQPLISNRTSKKKKGALAKLIFVGHSPRMADSRLRDPQERAGNDAQSGRRQ